MKTLLIALILATAGVALTQISACGYFDDKSVTTTSPEEVPVKTDWNGELLTNVKFFEGFKRKAYTCPGGVRTIGYGCTIKSIVNKGYISEPQAEKVLIKELAEARAIVLKRVKVELTEYQLSALTSFTFNCGEGNLSLLITGKDRLNGGNYESVEKKLPLYINAAGRPLKGLIKRRQWELKLWKGYEEGR